MNKTIMKMRCVLYAVLALVYASQVVFGQGASGRSEPQPKTSSKPAAKSKPQPKPGVSRPQYPHGTRTPQPGSRTATAEMSFAETVVWLRNNVTRAYTDPRPGHPPTSEFVSLDVSQCVLSVVYDNGEYTETQTGPLAEIDVPAIMVLDTGQGRSDGKWGEVVFGFLGGKKLMQYKNVFKDSRPSGVFNREVGGIPFSDRETAQRGVEAIARLARQCQSRRQ